MGNSIKHNISGCIIGDWQVLNYLGKGYYNCKCTSCGFEKKIQSWSLLHNQSIRCNKHDKNSLDNLIGKKIYEWEVLGKSSEYGKVQCRCSCGKISNVSKSRLLEGRTRSCGHASYGDITGQMFGKLKVIEYDSDKQRWLCQCECGNTEYWRLRDLRNDKRQRCCNQCKHSKLMDLTGKKIGKWTVIDYYCDGKWNTVCKCGRKGIVSGRALRNNESLGCKWCAGKGFIDLTGQKFGRIYVKEYIGNSKYKCICDCGNETIISGGDLRYRKQTQCTKCANNRLEDLTGKKFGHWTALSYSGNGYWECLCDCKNKTISEVHAYTLKHNKSTSCGCNKREKLLNTMLNKYGEVSIAKVNNPREKELIETFINDDRFSNYIKGLKEAPTVYNLTLEFNVTTSVMLKKIHKLNLEDFVAINSGSKYEDEILKYIDEIAPNLRLERHNRTVLNGQEIDIYIPDKKIGIEVNGSYWHSDIFKNRQYHQNKTVEAAKKHISIIHIFEHEWVDNESKIKKLLKQKLVGGTKIYARNTVIKEVDNYAVKELYNNNHLQGAINSQINIACYYNNNIIGAISVSTPRFSTKADYEITRLCWDSEYNVVGGTERLFKHLISSHNVDDIITYCDISKFTGNVYTRLGFSVDVPKPITEPNYIWLYKDSTGYTIYNRYKTQKDKLIKDGLGIYGSTEDEIMRNIGFIKIYDSGNLRLLWRKQQK